jgi:hypothetical protein
MAITVGSSVLVQWSDGNRYEGQALQEHGEHILVGFPNGQQHWVERQYLTEARPAAPPPQAARQPQQTPAWPAQVARQPQQQPQAARQPQQTPAQAQPARSVQKIGNAVEVEGGELEVQGGIRVYASAMEEWNEMQQVIAHVESHRISLGGIDVSQPITWWERRFAGERAQADGLSRDDAARRLGYQDEDHFRLIGAYVEAKWSYLGTENGKQVVRQHDEYTNSALRARMGETRQAQAQAAAADPSLLAPVNGVSVEKWAAAAVALGSLGQGATPAQVAQALAKVGLDKATYEAANAGWQAKMQGDTTGAIAQKFAEAFGGAAMGGGGGGGGGGEPCTFEQYVEIMAAQGAWSEQGFDVNAKLREVFGIDAVKYGQFSMYWAPKMGTDVALMNRYMELDAHYREKYAGQRMDDDLDL